MTKEMFEKYLEKMKNKEELYSIKRSDIFEVYFSGLRVFIESVMAYVDDGKADVAMLALETVIKMLDIMDNELQQYAANSDK